MVGITRIKIKSNWSDWRTQLSDDMAPVADGIYRKVFSLMDGNISEECTKEAALARYDWQEGIDVLLRTPSGSKKTLQEKFLTFGGEPTITFEETKGNGSPGAWYYTTAQYYFVGYCTKYTLGVLTFDYWMLLDLARFHAEDDAGRVKWGNRDTIKPDNPLGLRWNTRDNRKSSFRFVTFGNVPESSIFSSEYNRGTKRSVGQLALGLSY